MAKTTRKPVQGKKNVKKGASLVSKNVRSSIAKDKNKKRMQQLMNSRIIEALDKDLRSVIAETSSVKPTERKIAALENLEELRKNDEKTVEQRKATKAAVKQQIDEINNLKL